MSDCRLYLLGFSVVYYRRPLPHRDCVNMRRDGIMYFLLRLVHIYSILITYTYFKSRPRTIKQMVSSHHSVRLQTTLMVFDPEIVLQHRDGDIIYTGLLAMFKVLARTPPPPVPRDHSKEQLINDPDPLFGR